MSRTFGSLVAIPLVLATACSYTIVGNKPVFTATHTLQGTVMDALTGKRLGGDGLDVYLVQGAVQRKPDRLVRDDTDPMVGDFAFTSVPIAYNRGNVIYRLVVLNKNYIRFESDLDLSANGGEVVDSTYNRMGAVYLFPVGTLAPSYRFQLLFNTKPVPEAIAYLMPKSGSNQPLALLSNFVIPANTGYLQAVSAKSGADGFVEFKGSDLALGAVYALKIPPLVFEGVQLAQNDEINNVLVGKSLTTQIVNLTKAIPGNEFGLYIVSASNTVVGQVTPSGELSLKFSRKVILNNPDNFWATTDGNGVFPPPSEKRVRASLSQDGLTLTLSPIWATAPTSTTSITTLTYSSTGSVPPSVSVDGYPAVTFDPFSLDLSNGQKPSKTVFLSP